MAAIATRRFAKTENQLHNRRLIARLLPPWWASAPFVGIVAGVLTAVRLFVPVPIGLADNGDGPRLMCAFGVSAQVPPATAQWFKFAHFSYTRATQETCDPSIGYPGSGQWMLELAQPLSRWIGFTAEFDLRTLAIIFCCVVGFSFGVFASALKGSSFARLLICTLLFLVVADVIFAGYAASPYSETSGLLGLLLATAGAVHLGGSPRARVYGLLLFTVGAIVAVTSKTQAVTLVAPFMCLLIVSRVRIGWFGGRLSSRIPPLLAAASIAFSAAFMIQAHPANLREINPTEVVLVNLLGKSSDPGSSAVELGLPETFVKYAGQSWWEAHPEQDPQWPQARRHMSYGNIAHFLLHHPSIAVEILHQAVGDFTVAETDYLGSYSPTSEKPAGARESRLTVFRDTLQMVGGGPALVALLGIGTAVFWCLRRLQLDPHRRAVLAAMLCMTGATIVQLLTAAYGEAIENTKHLVFSILSSGLAFVLLADALPGGRFTVASPFCWRKAMVGIVLAMRGRRVRGPQ